MSLDLGSAVVSTAVFGVPPKTLPAAAFQRMVTAKFCRTVGRNAGQGDREGRATKFNCIVPAKS